MNQQQRDKIDNWTNQHNKTLLRLVYIGLGIGFVPIYVAMFTHIQHLGIISIFGYVLSIFTFSILCIFGGSKNE